VRDDADRFRLRAAECRRLAADARDEASRRGLNSMADELEAEANKIDAEGGDPPMPMPPAS